LKRSEVTLDVRSMLADGVNHYTGNWNNTPSTGTALFNEKQYNLFKHLLRGIKNVIYFAGEHLSVH